MLFCKFKCGGAQKLSYIAGETANIFVKNVIDLYT